MLLFSGAISEFVERHPTVKMLALSFLLLIGVALIAEGFDKHIPKGYIYFAMSFSLCVEMLNLRMRKVMVGRIATGVLVGLGLLWVPFINRLSSQLYIYLQSVQAYISPPIAACFVLGILWPRANGKGAISCLLTGLVLGATRFILEVLDKSVHFEASALRWLLDINFLHYAILMFAVCSAVLVVVSLLTPAPDRAKLAGLTFATVDEKLDATVVAGRAAALRRESPFARRLNLMLRIVGMPIVTT